MCSDIGSMPSFFEWLKNQKLVTSDHILHTEDGFFMVTESLSSMLLSKGIDTFPDREGQTLKCELFFDDWFLFSVPHKDFHVYGLLKMREQEHDLKSGIPADADTPGVTVSFIDFNESILKACIENGSPANRKTLGMEINRVVAYPKQNHHPALKAYFIRPEAEAAYLIADQYIAHIVSSFGEGAMKVPEAYREIYLKRNIAAKYSRIPNFLDQNNRNANTIICDHQHIFIKDRRLLSEEEKCAILAVHTGNVSVHSFAAEIRFHAMFLTDLAKISLPLAGSPYASAIRADMSIGDKEFQGPTPYYNLSGTLIMEQIKHHRNENS